MFHGSMKAAKKPKKKAKEAAGGAAGGAPGREIEIPKGQPCVNARIDCIKIWICQAFDVTGKEETLTDLFKILMEMFPEGKGPFHVDGIDFRRVIKVLNRVVPYTLEHLLPKGTDIFSFIVHCHSAFNQEKRHWGEVPRGYHSFVSFGKGVYGKTEEHKSNRFNLHMIEYSTFARLLYGLKLRILCLAFCQSYYLTQELLDNDAADFIIYFGDENEEGNDGVSALFMTEFVRLFYKRLSEINLTNLSLAVFHAFKHAYVELGRDYHGPSDVLQSNKFRKYAHFTTNKTFNAERAKKEKGYIADYHFCGKPGIVSKDTATPYTVDDLERERAANMATWVYPA